MLIKNVAMACPFGIYILNHCTSWYTTKKLRLV